MGDRVEEVRISLRLQESPACLVLSEHDMGASMRRIMSATGQKVPESKPTLEINASHPLVKYLESVADEEHFKELPRCCTIRPRSRKAASSPTRRTTCSG